MILITTDPISITTLRGKLPIAAHCGAAVWFEGVVRNQNDGHPVTAIEYECYASMAEAELGKIATEAQQRWPIDDILVAHRYGCLAVGEISLVIGCSSPHRAEAFMAVQYIVDELKQRVPIWKREMG